MPNNNDLTIGELGRKIDDVCSKIDSLLEEQVDQGRDLARINLHLKTLNSKVKKNADRSKQNNKYITILIGMGILLAVLIPASIKLMEIL